MDQKSDTPEGLPFDDKPIGLSKEEKSTLFLLLNKIGFDWSTDLEGKVAACNISPCNIPELFMGAAPPIPDANELPDATDLAAADATDDAGRDTQPHAPSPTSSAPEPGDELPTLPDSIFPTLPALLQKVVAITCTNKERDCMLLVAMVTISSCLHKFSALYDGKLVYSNLYLYITAPASAGKGRMENCMLLVDPIHEALRRKTALLKEKYEMALEEYKRHKLLDPSMRRPVQPPELKLFIPADNSATGLFQMLAENQGQGLIFETEGDAMAQGFRADNKIFSMGMRKAFHHERISYNRRTKREYIEIRFPRLSVMLTGTPGQVSNLIPNAENGLFSRYMFYHMTQMGDWKDVFADNEGEGLGAYFQQLGKEFHSLFKKLERLPAITFRYSKAQQKEFNAFFTQIQATYLALQGPDYMATIRRLGLIAYRLTMIFTALRMNDTGNFAKEQQCAEVDFQAALAMVSVLIEHSGHLFNELQQLHPSKGQASSPMLQAPCPKLSKFLAQLPAQFSSQDFKALAMSLSISERSAKRYIAYFCEKGLVRREDHGMYTNLMLLPPESDKK